MTHEARAKTIGDFRKKKDIKIMVASLKCGGVGLNLTCASRVINIDLFWVRQRCFIFTLLANVCSTSRIRALRCKHSAEFSGLDKTRRLS